MIKKSRPSEQCIQQNLKVIGEQIKTFREKWGLSQNELSDIKDVNRTTISKVETGRFAFTNHYLLKFACYLDFSISVPEKQVK